ncbi:Vps54-domain-containing protein [Ramicandelaber brevisporus]|nr:Vps54-domain-containing protein [Ramicandelaber brevisporus]
MTTRKRWSLLPGAAEASSSTQHLQTAGGTVGRQHHRAPSILSTVSTTAAPSMRLRSAPSNTTSGTMISSAAMTCIESTHQQTWMTRDIGVNAISSVAINPMTKDRQYNVLIDDRLISTNETQFPVVSGSDFNDYLAMVTPLFSNASFKIDGDNGGDNGDGDGDGDNASDKIKQQQQEHNNGRSSVDNGMSGSTLSGILDSSPSSSSLSNHTHEAAQISSTNQNVSDANSKLLESVPSIFFNDKFQLSDPSTFETVLDLLRPKDSTADQPLLLLDSKLTPDSLSGYLDIVESRLTQEITRRSTSFFKALSSLQDLYNQTSECIEQVKLLRDNIKAAQSSYISHGLNVAKLRGRKYNIDRLIQLVEVIAEINSVQPAIAELVSSNDLVLTIDIARDAIFILERHGSNLDGNASNGSGNGNGNGNDELRQTVVFQQLDSDIRQMMNATVARAESELASLMISDCDVLNRSINWNNFTSNIQINSGQLPSINPVSFELIKSHIAALQIRITPLIRSLVSVDKLKSSLQIYREGNTGRIDDIFESIYLPSFPRLNKPYPSFTDALYQSHLGSSIRALSLNQFMDLLTLTYSNALLIMGHTAATQWLIARILSSISNDQQQGSSTNRDALIENVAIIKTNTMASQFSSNTTKPTANQAGAMWQDSLRGDQSKHQQQMGTHSNANSKHRTLQTPFPPPEDPGAEFSTQHQYKLNYPVEYVNCVNELSDTLDYINENSCMRASKLLQHRSDQNSKLSLSEFYKLFALSWAFVTNAEHLNGGRTCYSLRGTITVQSRAFLGNFHTIRLNKLVGIVEMDDWSQTTVPSEFQKSVDKIVQAAGISLFNIQSNTAATTNSNTNINNNNSNSDDVVSISDNSSVNNDSNDTLEINNQRYPMVRSCLMFITTIVEYLQVAVNIPLLASDILHRLVEIIKLYNDKVCHAILAAGARRSAGLQGINAKHIILASRSLDVVVALLPYIRQTMKQALVQPKQAVLLSEFDRLESDFNKHQSDLHAKLVSIVAEYTGVHCMSVLTTDWDNVATSSLPQSSSNNGRNTENSDSPLVTLSDDSIQPFVEKMVKEARLISRILSKYSTVEVRHSIITEILNLYCQRLESAFRQIEISTAAGKRILLANMQHLSRKLASLDNSSGTSTSSLGTKLEVAVNNVVLGPKTRSISSANATSSPAGTGASIKSSRATLSSNSSPKPSFK